MPAILILLLFVALKYFEVGFVDNLSWWWIVGFAFVLFLWFDFFERMLGLDRRKEDAHYEKMQEERNKRTFSKGKTKR